MLRSLDRLDDLAAGLALFACFTVVCVEMTGRSFFGVSWLWSEELSRYLIIASTYFGASAAVRTREHIRVELLIDRFGPRARRLAEIAIALACAALTGVVAVVGTRWVGDTASLGLMSAESSLPVPIWVFQAVVPIGFGLMALRFLAQAVSLARRGARAPEGDPVAQV